MTTHSAGTADDPSHDSQPDTDSPPPATAVRLLSLENAIVIAAHGDLDLYSTPRFRRVLLDAIATEPTLPIAVDLHGVEFIDSAGFAALVEAQKHLVKRGRVLNVLMAPKSQPMRVFMLMGFASFMTLLPSLDALT